MWATPQKPSLTMAARRVARSWKPALAVFAVCFSLVAVITLLLPTKYQAQLKILVNNERVDPILSPDKQTQGILYLDEVSESRINTEIELLTSTDTLRQVVVRCHLADSKATRQRSQQVREEAALRQLQKDLVVAPIRKSNVIEVRYQSKDPRRATEVLRALSDLYLGAHLKLHGAPGSYDFFRQLSVSYSRRLEQAEADLAGFRQAHAIVTLPEEKALALQRAAELEKLYAESSAATQKSGQQASRLKSSVEATPATIERERRSMPNQYAIEQLSTTLIGLQNKRAQAVLRYQPADRIVKELDTQIAQTQSALTTARKSSAEEVTRGANPTLGNAETEFIRTQADYEGNRAQTARIAEEIRLNRARLLTLDEQTVPYEDLVRNVKQLEELSETYKKMTDQARVADMLDTQRISNVAIAEQPFVSSIPASPKRGLILSLGFVWSLLLAIGTAVGMDFLTERVTSPFELEQAMGVPLLAAVPTGAIAPSYGGSFPALYIAMQRTDIKANRSFQ
jgi:uncharacterized protein involved in exopolysaccharide biosynthesis